MIKVKGKRIAKKVAGVFVKRAPPKAKPESIAVSKRNFLTVITAKIKVQIPNIESIESVRAIESKKTANGEIA